MKKLVAVALILIAFIAGITSGIWVSTPDAIMGAPKDASGQIPSWAFDLCTCEKNGIRYVMPDIWHRGPETE